VHDRAVAPPRRRTDVELTSLPLSPIDGFVLSRIDGQTDVAQLVQVTGLPLERLNEVLDRLRLTGAIEADEPPPVESSELHEEEAPDAPDEPESPTHRALYMQSLAGLPLDERIGLAHQATEPELSAWCFDGHARVIHALLDNPRTGLGQARLIARHHRDATGLEAMCARANFAADDVVRRELLRNPQLQPALTRRLYGHRRALEQWKWCSSREVTEQTRRTLRETFRTRFSTTVSEEKVEVILKTEGRCLAGLSGIGLDSKTTTLLCARTYGSVTLIQNFARWSACPPPLIAHLLRQVLVKRQPQLKALLMQHTNAPRPG
jgi:hypothetical protein